MQLLRLSVVTVSLNAAATVRDTLASVALQDIDFGMEHICVDGGSTDATRQIIDECAERWPHITRVFEPDAGIFDAMNKGLHAARGEFVLYLNADDFLTGPDVLAATLSSLPPGSPDTPDMILGDVAMGRLGQRGVWRHRQAPRVLAKTRGSGFFPVHQGIFAKRALLQRVGGLDPTLKLGSDVTQFYDLERVCRPVLQFVGSDTVFMTAGGAANASFRAMCTGTREIYRHLRRFHGRGKAMQMVFMKTLQSLLELRVGQCPHRRWFAGTTDIRAS
jgi:glycosyltransferase involved in cell wall biosynthesis